MVERSGSQPSATNLANLPSLLRMALVPFFLPAVVCQGAGTAPATTLRSGIRHAWRAALRPGAGGAYVERAA